jgi:hypothetical protein
MSSTPPTAHTHALKRSVTKSADDENKGTFPLKRQASGEQREFLLIKTFTPSCSCYYPEDSSDDEADKVRRLDRFAAMNKRREETEARNDDDATRLFSRGLSPSSTKDALLKLHPRATFPPGMRLVLVSAQSSASSQNSSADVTPRKAAFVSSSGSAQSSAAFSHDDFSQQEDFSPELLPKKKGIIAPFA